MTRTEYICLINDMIEEADIMIKNDRSNGWTYYKDQCEDFLKARHPIEITWRDLAFKMIEARIDCYTLRQGLKGGK